MKLVVNRGDSNWREFVLRSALFIALGIYMVCVPLGIGVVILCVILGFLFLFRGVSLFFFFRKKDKSWSLGVAAIFIMIFGMLILLNPAFGNRTLIPWTANGFIITGILYAFLGFGLKQSETAHESLTLETRQTVISADKIV